MRLVKLMFLVAMLTVSTRADAALTSVASFGANPGALDMFEYVPSGLAAGRPLVVVLHGCTQTAAAMQVAGWNALADKHDFAVLYPQQRSANQQLSCFTWYSNGDISRASGEAASIIAMIDAEIARHAIDRERVYVTGLSAGGAFTTVMLAAYPDRFEAGSIMAGLPYKCATDLGSASSCQQMSSSAQKTPDQWGDRVRAAHSGFSGRWPRVQIWQGTADHTVAPANATELIEQWTNVWGIDQTADATETISTATRTQYTDSGTVAVELYMIAGMGHAIAKGTDALGECPTTSGAYFSDAKVCSTLRTAEFFGLLPSGGGGGGGGGSGSGGGDGGGDDGGGGAGDGSDDPVDDLGGCATGRGCAGSALVLAVACFVIRRRRRDQIDGRAGRSK